MRKRVSLYGLAAFETRPNTKDGREATSVPPIFPHCHPVLTPRTGWPGWGDYLGIHNRWSKTSILAFVSSIAPLLNRFQPSEIYAILRQNGCLIAVDSLADSSPLNQLVQALLHQDIEGIEHSLRDLRLENLDDTEILAYLSRSPESDEITETIVSLSEERSWTTRSRP